MKHQIIITIDPKTGEVKSTVKGVTGKACSQVSKWVDELGEVTSDQHTADYHKEPKPVVKIGYNQN
jgi:hypothetical protein